MTNEHRHSEQRARDRGDLHDDGLVTSVGALQIQRDASSSRIKHATVGGVAAELRSGSMLASEVPVGIVNMSETSLIVNTRSALALTRARISRAEWSIVDVTAAASTSSPSSMATGRGQPVRLRHAPEHPRLHGPGRGHVSGLERPGGQPARLVVNAATCQVVQQIAYDEFGRVLGDTNPGFSRSASPAVSSTGTRA